MSYPRFQQSEPFNETASKRKVDSEEVGSARLSRGYLHQRHQYLTGPPQQGEVSSPCCNRRLCATSTPYLKHYINDRPRIACGEKPQMPRILGVNNVFAYNS